MKRLSLSLFSTAGIVLSLSLSGMLAPQAAHAQTYSGDAYGVFLSISPAFPLPGVSTTVNDTGSLPSAGGSLSASVLTATVNNGGLTVLTAGVISSATSGSAGLAQSSSTVNSLSALNLLSASTVTSHTQANASGVAGSSTITNLFFNGSSVVVTGAPNQTINVQGLGTLIINEQIDSSVGNHHQITTNALDLSLLDSTKLIVSHSESDFLGLAVPEPSETAALGLGIFGLAALMFFARRRAPRFPLSV